MRWSFKFQLSSFNFQPQMQWRLCCYCFRNIRVPGPTNIIVYTVHYNNCIMSMNMCYFNRGPVTCIISGLIHTWIEPRVNRIHSLYWLVIFIRSEIRLWESGILLEPWLWESVWLFKRVEPRFRFSIWNRVEPGNRRNCPSLISSSSTSTIPSWFGGCPYTDEMYDYEAVHAHCFPSVCEKKSTGDSDRIRNHDLLLTSADVFNLSTTLFFGKNQNWYFHLSKWGKITTWHEVQAIKCHTKDQRKCMVHFEDKGVFPMVH